MTDSNSNILLSAKEYQQKISDLKYYSPPTTAEGNLTLKQFFDLMYHMLQIEKPGLVFVPAWPEYLIPSTPEYKKTMDNPTDMFADTITYMVTREEPGSVGGDKQPFGTKREVVPRVREIKNTYGDKSQVIYGQITDTLIQFDLWTLTNFEAEDLALWFKRFMTTHRMFLKNMGLSEILFWWRGRDSVSADLRNNLNVRTLVYFVRTEDISYEEDYNLKELKIQLDKIKG